MAPWASTTATKRLLPPPVTVLVSVTGMSTDPPAPMVAACSPTTTALLASKGSRSKPPPGTPEVNSADSTASRRTEAPAGPVTRTVCAACETVAGVGTPTTAMPGVGRETPSSLAPDWPRLPGVRKRFTSPAPFLENRPDLDQPVLYAEDRRAGNFELFDRFTDRPIYRLAQQHEDGDELLEPSLVPTRLHLEEGDDLALDLRVTNPTKETHVVAYITDGRGRKTQLVDSDSTWAESYDVSWRLAAADEPADGPADERTFTPRETDAGMLTVGLALDDTTTTTGDVRWERRIPYRTVGDEVQLILPGQGYELLASEGRRHWIPRNVDDRLAEAPPA